MPEYMDRDPKGWMGDPSRGAALGRINKFPPFNDAPIGRLTLRRIPLNRSGYDRLGTYWGIGEPLYWCADDHGELDWTFRAADRETAKAYVHGKLGAVSFWR